MPTPDITVIIPSLNPDEKLEKTVQDLLSAGFTDIILVNDGSKEDCVPFFPQGLPGCTLLTHEVNRGKGAALKTAFRYYLDSGRKNAGVITVDGDGQHLSEDVLRCAEAMCDSGDAFLGVRDFSDPTVPARSRFGNRTTSVVFRLFCGLRVSDTQTGLRAIPREHLPALLTVDGDRYEYETNALLKMNALGIPCREVKIHTVYIEENQTSHFRPVRDSLRIYGLILKFISSSLIASLVDLGLFYFLRELVLTATMGRWAVTAASVTARVVSSFVNFLINRHAVFKSRADGKASVVRYYVLVVGIMLLSTAAVNLFVFLLQTMDVFDSPAIETLGKFAIDTALCPLSFRLQREWVFRDKKSTKRSQP